MNDGPLLCLGACFSAAGGVLVEIDLRDGAVLEPQPSLSSLLALIAIRLCLVGFDSGSAAAAGPNPRLCRHDMWHANSTSIRMIIPPTRDVCPSSTFVCAKCIRRPCQFEWPMLLPSYGALELQLLAAD